MAKKAPSLGTGMAERTKKIIQRRPKQIEDAVNGKTPARKAPPKSGGLNTSTPTAKNPPGIQKTKAQGDAEKSKLQAKRAAEIAKKLNKKPLLKKS